MIRRCSIPKGATDVYRLDCASNPRRFEPGRCIDGGEEGILGAGYMWDFFSLPRIKTSPPFPGLNMRFLSSFGRLLTGRVFKQSMCRIHKSRLACHPLFIRSCRPDLFRSKMALGTVEEYSTYPKTGSQGLHGTNMAKLITFRCCVSPLCENHEFMTVGSLVFCG